MTLEIKDIISKNENWYKGKNHNIKYLYINEPSSNELLVVLSGFNGREAQGVQGKYNYLRSLIDIPINKLFIIDSVDNVPVYYYGVNDEPTYLNDVKSLIYNIMRNLDTSEKNLPIAGSSKGGTGALLVGLSMGAEHIISGANQLYVGTYLTEINEKVQDMMFEKIVGKVKNKEEKLNAIFKKELLIDSTNSKLYFHAGNRDSRYYIHMKPMLKHFDDHEILYELDLRNYSGHDKVGPYFSSYIYRKVTEILSEPMILEPNMTTISEENFNLELRIKNFDNSSMEIAVYLYSNKAKVLELPYSKNLQREVDMPLSKITNMTIFLKQGKSVIQTLKYPL